MYKQLKFQILYHYDFKRSLSFDRSWSVSWYRNNFFENRFWGWSITSVSFIHNLGNVTRISIGCVISNNLSTTIWKSYTVLSGCRIAITFFILTKVYSAVFIFYTILICVFWRSVCVNWTLTMNRCWMVRRTSSKSNSQDCTESNDNLL